jgi:hexokinase
MRWGSMLSWLLYSDPTDELLMIIGIFTHFFALETTLAERQFFRALAKLIGKRSARLSACGIAAIASKKGHLEEGCSVGADGSLYNVRIAILRICVCSWLISGTEIPRIRRQSA